MLLCWAVFAAVQVSEGGGVMGGFVSGHDHADVDRESDDVEDLEDSIPYIEDFEDWPDAPVMLCPDPAAAQQVRPPRFVGVRQSHCVLLGGLCLSSDIHGPRHGHALSVNG